MIIGETKAKTLGLVSPGTLNESFRENPKSADFPGAVIATIETIRETGPEAREAASFP
ncbi:hypothetical protein X767_04385 [Mesorhizobium sp. LSJC264A00]|nr:hypothetical protein X767_04385 [Mesorhizobium sp. LSJC264A00]